MIMKSLPVCRQCGGRVLCIVGMAGVSMKDGLVKLLKKDSITRGINVSLDNNKLVLDFHVIVAYGVSILAVTDNLISNVKLRWKSLPVLRSKRSTSMLKV